MNKYESILEQIYGEYPRLRQHGFGLGYAPDKQAQGYMEFFSPDEEYSPMPEVPYVEVYDEKYLNPNDVMGDMLHYLPLVDPRFAKMREDIWNSRTPQQRAMTDRAYQYSRENFGEERPFDDWVRMNRKDAFMRGYLNDQWDKSMYTDQQKGALEGLREYLKDVN